MNSSVVADVDLTVPERSALLVLMHFVKEVSNPQIEEQYGFTIDGKVRGRLEKLGYLTSWRLSAPGRPFVHELTESGWQRGDAELAAEAPKGVHRAYRLFYPALNDFARFLAHHGFRIADVYDPEITRAAGPGAAGPDERIRAAYLELATTPEGWVSLDRLREALADLPRDEVDAALLRLDLLPGVHLVPEDNQKALSARQRAASLRVGGEDKHLLAMDSTAAP